MKELLTGNEAVALGVWEAGVTVAAAYPGTPSTEIMENLSKYPEINCEWSPNEKVAVEVAGAASIAGARAFASMKHVGLNVAADPFFAMGYVGSNGGMVIVSADDPGAHSSQDEQDNRWFGKMAKMAVVEPADSAECRDFIKEAYRLSEELDTAVLFRMTTRVCHSKSLVEKGEREEVGFKTYTKNPKKTVMVPAHSLPKHKEIENERLPKLLAYSNSTFMNRLEWGTENEIGVIANGAAYHYAKEVFGDKASYLKVGFSNPMPTEKIVELASKVQKIYVIEEGDDYMEQAVKALGIRCTGKEIFPKVGEFSPAVLRAALGESLPESVTVDVAAPPRPPVLCAGCPHRGIFYAMSKVKDAMVMTDIGCYTLGIGDPLFVGDAVLCMGGGISGAIGMDKVRRMDGRPGRVFGVLGDSTFFHSGMTGILDAVYNDSKMIAVILDNSITAMTGHQENPGTGKHVDGTPAPAADIPTIVRALGVPEECIRIVDPYDLKACRQAVKEATEYDGFSVIITKRPCALIKSVQKERAGLCVNVDTEKCRACKACLTLGCPALSWKDGRIEIDTMQCNGCGLCASLCAFGALSKVGE